MIRRAVLFLLVFLILLAGCDTSGTPATAKNAVLKTSAGEVTIASSRLVDEVNGVMAGANEKILLVLLRDSQGKPLDPGSFSLETFDKSLRNNSQGEVHISGADGVYGICSMMGWTGEKRDEFAMGFRIPAAAKELRLIWPGNEAIQLAPES